MQVKTMTQQDQPLIIHPVLLYIPEVVYNIPYMF